MPAGQALPKQSSEMMLWAKKKKKKAASIDLSND